MIENKGKYGRHILKSSAANTEKMKNEMSGRNSVPETVLVALSSSSM